MCQLHRSCDKSPTSKCLLYETFCVTDIPVITIVENQSGNKDKEEPTDDKMAAQELTGKTLSGKEDNKDDTEIFNMYKSGGSSHDTLSSQPCQSKISSEWRKRPNSEISSTPPNASSRLVKLLYNHSMYVMIQHFVTCDLKL